jgi:hypothetical protein
VLPGECYRVYDVTTSSPPSSSSSSSNKEKGIQMGGGGLAPGLVERKRRVERERVKDGLRGWLGGRWVGEWSRRKAEREREGEGERVGVGRLVRRFSRRGDVGEGNGREGRWGKKRGGEREEPARAKVLGLRRFWEGVGRDGGSY